MIPCVFFVLGVDGFNFSGVSGQDIYFNNNKGKALNCPSNMKQGNSSAVNGVFCIKGYFFSPGHQNLTYFDEIDQKYLQEV